MGKKFRKLNAEFFIFEKKGQVLEGTFHRGGDIETVNGLAQTASIVDEAGEAHRFIVSSGMQSLIEVKEGAYIRITCNGKQKNAKTGREYMAFDLEVADDDDEE